jgi:hypothetical protein
MNTNEHVQKLPSQISGQKFGICMEKLELKKENLQPLVDNFDEIQTKNHQNVNTLKTKSKLFCN